MSTTSRRSSERLIEAVKALPPITTSVAHPCDESSLACAVDAAKLGIIAPILVGPQKKILAAALGGLDPTDNSGHGPRHSTATSRVSAWVIPTNEELMIARHTRTLVGQR